MPVTSVSTQCRRSPARHRHGQQRVVDHHVGEHERAVDGAMLVGLLVDLHDRRGTGVGPRDVGRGEDDQGQAGRATLLCPTMLRRSVPFVAATATHLAMSMALPASAADHQVAVRRPEELDASATRSIGASGSTPS